MALASRTLSREIVPAAGGTAPYLFLVLVCDRLAVPSLRLSLRGTEALAIGRGDLQRRQLRRGEDGEVALTVPDDRMSVRHATLRRLMGSWVLSDGGSRNGTFVKGRRIDREVLADGDLIELGHSFLLFRSGIATAATDPALLYSDELGPGASGFHTLLPSLAADFRRLEAIARSSVSVVIHGETGTGKEVVASGLHALSGRRGRFVAVKCAALSRTDDVSGLVRSAAGGTLFLDAVEELPAAAQPLLSRVLEHAEVSPGSFTQPLPIHLLRVIAATQQDLDALATKQQFRSDLLARLSGLTLALPPLRERREDLGLLIRAVLKRHAGQLSKGPALTCDAARALLLHPWPRNIRELEKDLQAALVLAGQEAVGLRHLPGNLQEPPAQVPVPAPVPQAAPSSPAMKMQHFVDELWRRHVVRVLVAYAVALFGALQGADVIVTRLDLPPRWMTFIVAAGLAGFPIAGVLAWIFDWTRQGIVRTPPLSRTEQATLASGKHWRRRALAFVVCIVALLAAIGVLWRRNHT